MLYLIRPSCLQISNSRSLKKCSIIYHVSVIFNCEIFILSQTPSENMLKRMNGDRCKFPSYCMQTSWTYVHTFPARVGDLHIQISIGYWLWFYYKTSKMTKSSKVRCTLAIVVSRPHFIPPAGETTSSLQQYFMAPFNCNQGLFEWKQMF